MQCPHCKSTDTVRPNAAFDQGSSSHVGLGLSSDGAVVGVGLSKTKEAKKARDLMYKESSENLGADESNADKQTQAMGGLLTVLMYFILFGVIGFRWEGYGDSFFLSILMLALWVIGPLLVSFLIAQYFGNKLKENSDYWNNVEKRSVSYWMCRSCGKDFKI